MIDERSDICINLYFQLPAPMFQNDHTWPYDISLCYMASTTQSSACLSRYMYTFFIFLSVI